MVFFFWNIVSLKGFNQENIQQTMQKYRVSDGNFQSVQIFFFCSHTFLSKIGRNYVSHMIQCKPDISRLVGSMERYRDISGSAIYRATAMSQNPSQVFQRVVSGDGAFVCLAANSARRQRISWHLSKFHVALQNRVVEFQTKAVCA